MSTSVYCILNLKNRKLYYGKAADPQQRWYTHCWAARKGRDLPLALRRAEREGQGAGHSVAKKKPPEGDFSYSVARSPGSFAYESPGQFHQKSRWPSVQLRR